MHITVACSFPLNRWGGASVVANELARCYIEAGHKVTLLSISPQAPAENGKSILGVDAINFKTGADKVSAVIVREALNIYNPSACRFLREFVEANQPDCVHFHSLHGGISAYAVQVVKRLGIPAIVTFHEFWAVCAAYNLASRIDSFSECLTPEPLKCLLCQRREYPYAVPIPFRNQLIRKYVSLADFIFMPSQFAQKQLVANGFPENKVKTIYNGVDVGRFYPASDGYHSEKGSLFRVLYVGRVRYKKGFTHLVDACAALVGQGYPLQLEVIGDSQPELKNNSFVRFVGSVDRDTLPQHYRAADVLVQPSIIHESFGLALVEGMASGVPVIATNMGGMPEVVEECGMIVLARDRQALAQAIESLVLNPDLRKQLGQEGRERVQRLFTWESKAREYLEHLANLVYIGSTGTDGKL